MKFKIKYSIKKIFSAFLVFVIFFFLQAGHESQNVLSFQDTSIEIINFILIMLFSFLYFSFSLFIVYKFIFKTSFLLLFLFNFLWLLHIYINFNSFLNYELIIFSSKNLSMFLLYFIFKNSTKKELKNKKLQWLIILIKSFFTK